MTVQELIHELQDFDPEMEVMFAYPSGDYWRTTLASEPSPRGISEGEVVYSDYHRTNKVSEDGEGETVVLIS
jgi:hypothetical protein